MVNSGRKTVAHKRRAELHFGLGLAAAADRLDIVWPNGKAETLRDIKPDQTLTAREGSGVVRK